MQTSRWKLIISACISLGILILAYRNRAWIGEAFGLLAQAQPLWLGVAFGTICLSYLVSAQVFAVVLHSLGYRMGMLRLWATALVAIMTSQSVPAGGVASYAFILGNFNRRGVTPGESALIASLETLSYVMAMVLIFGFSLIYFAIRGLATAEASYLAAVVALAVIGGAAFVLTRSESTLHRWVGALERGVGRALRRPWHGAWAEQLVKELSIGRALLASRRRDVLTLVLIQLTALSGHSLAMLIVLHALGATVSFASVLAAFGVALVTSTFNVLPGGGGTVEAALIAVLSQLGAGSAAVPAAIIFRLFNFWLLAPVAAVAYHWLMHERAAPMIAHHRRATPSQME